MKCTKCGEPMPMGAKYCTECGARMPEQADREPNVRFDPQTEQRAEPVPVAPAGETGETAERPLYHAPVGAEAFVQTQEPTGEPLPRMKWFKFLINFALWVSGLLNAWNGLQLMTGLIYSGDAELVYTYLPALRVYDIAYGVLLLACAAFAIFTRFQLARFRKIGPTCLYTLYIAQELIGIAYAAVTSAMIGSSMLDGSALASTATVAVMVIINVRYFQKRRHLFVN